MIKNDVFLDPINMVGGSYFKKGGVPQKRPFLVRNVGLVATFLSFLTIYTGWSISG